MVTGLNHAALHLTAVLPQVTSAIVTTILHGDRLEPCCIAPHSFTAKFELYNDCYHVTWTAGLTHAALHLTASLPQLTFARSITIIHGDRPKPCCRAPRSFTATIVVYSDCHHITLHKDPVLPGRFIHASHAKVLLDAALSSLPSDPLGSAGPAPLSQLQQKVAMAGARDDRTLHHIAMQYSMV
jgi:hypothetical protein